LEDIQGYSCAVTKKFKPQKHNLNLFATFKMLPQSWKVGEDNSVPCLHLFSLFYLLNVFIEWLIVLLHILEVQGLILDPEAGCPDLSLSFFPQYLQENSNFHNLPSIQ
jgi:hypothetical protein